MRTALLPSILTLCLAAACGRGSTSSTEGKGGPVSPGAALYAETTCIDCHGRGGAGGSLGPPLENLSAHWDSATLAAYLEDPRPFLRQDERLARLGQRYIMSMPSFRRLDPAERTILAEHLLATHP